MKDLKSIAGSVFEAFTEQVQTDDKDDILMNGIDSFQGSVKRNDVEKTFQDLYSEWDNGIADFSLIAMLNEVETPLVNRLDLVAFLKYYASREVVIFGHTHQYLMVGGNPTPNSPLQEMTQCSSPELYNANLNFIYANSGAWEDHTSVCTFIETERVEWTHTVRVKQYTKDQKINLLDERYVDLTMKRIEEFIADAIKVVDDGLEAGLKEINGSFQWSDSIGVELGNILRNNYQLDVQGAANVLAKAKVVANKAAKALMVYYAGGEKGPIDEILKKAGYAEDEISKIIHLILKPHIPPIPHIHIHHFPF